MHGTYIKQIGITHRKVLVPQISLDKGFGVVNKEIKINQTLILRRSQLCCKLHAA